MKPESWAYASHTWHWFKQVVTRAHFPLSLLVFLFHKKMLFPPHQFIGMYANLLGKNTINRPIEVHNVIFTK